MGGENKLIRGFREKETCWTIEREGKRRRRGGNVQRKWFWLSNSYGNALFTIYFIAVSSYFMNEISKFNLGFMELKFREKVN